MIKPLNILIVDDHPTIIEGYKSILFSKYAADEVIITTVLNCENAYHILSKNKQPFDVVLLDLELPPFEQEKLFSGEDLAVLIRKKNENTRIIILTSHTEAFILYHLTKKINPEGLLVKSDFNPEELLYAVELILENGSYYSATVRKSIKEVAVRNDALDSCDRRIILLLAKGIKTKNLPEHIGLTIGAIDKRKAKIKMFFDIQKGNDEDILREAKKRGLV